MTDPTIHGDRVVRVEEKKGRGKLGLILGILLLVVLAAVAAVVILAGRNTQDAKKDVTIKSCQADPQGGKPKASGQILNHTSKTSNYVVKIKFKDAQGNSLSEGAAPVQSVNADKTATWELTGARAAKGPLTCELTGVSRTHVPGQ
jgi:hypothetical protein